MKMIEERRGRGRPKLTGPPRQKKPFMVRLHDVTLSGIATAASQHGCSEAKIVREILESIYGPKKNQKNE